MSLRRVCDLFTNALAWEGADVGCLESRVILGGNESVAAVMIQWVMDSESVSMSCGVVGMVSDMLDVSDESVSWYCFQSSGLALLRLNGGVVACDWVCVVVLFGKGMLSDTRIGRWSDPVFSSVNEVDCELLMDGGRSVWSMVEFKGWL